MKTIEEKARAYDRAKDIMEKYLKSGNAGVIAENTIKNAFPELHENEDEIVKEELINYLKHRCNSTTLSGEERACNKWIDWLEKQDSNLVKNGYTNNKDVIEYAGNYSREIWRKLMDNFKNIKDYHIGCNDVSDIVLNAIIDTYNWLEKQGEKEFTFKSIPRLLEMIEPTDRAKSYCQKLIDTLAKEGYNTDAKIVEEVLKGWNGEDVPMAVMDEKQGEQKPIDWSKHIKYNPNSPSIIKESNWSEEDESMYTRTLGILGKCYMGQLPTKVEEELKWFKSIRDRYTWKPSDEQMEALEHFIIHHNGSTNYAKDLEELRIQLKKLKGE